MPTGLISGVGEALLRPASLLSDSFHQGEILRETAHRPWPLPDRPWLMGQSWIDLAFLHWPVDAEALEQVVPPELRLDTYKGTAWLGITPFLVRGVRLRGTAPVPAVSEFPEVNVRTYVVAGGRPGIYFLSLDADSYPAVLAARRAYRLPYFRSRISIERAGEWVGYRAERVDDDGPACALDVSYLSTGAPAPARDGSFEAWAAERYCLYTLDERHRVLRGDIHHPPWPLSPGEAEVRSNTMAEPYDLALEGKPVVHVSRRQDVAIWAIRPVD
jgi:uncharacterized protein